MGRFYFFAILCAATAVGVFYVPYLFPPQFPCVSVSYLAGFNNRVAVAFAATLSAISIFYFSRNVEEDQSPDLHSDTQMPYWLLGVGCVFCIVFTSLLTWMVAQSKVTYFDPSYFIDRLRASVIFNRHPYVDLEYPYGPLMFYVPVLVYKLLHPLGWSLTASYYASFVLLAVGGICLLFYFINELPLPAYWKRVSFLIFLAQGPNFILGINYTYFRFVLPFAFFLFIVKRRTISKLVLSSSVAVFTGLSVSAELGIALTAGILGYALLQILTGNKKFLMVALGPIGGFALFLFVFGVAPLATLGQFGRGAFNFVVQPLFCILILLVALVWLVPQIVARSLSRAHRDLRIPGLYIISLALLPAAIGRADPMHVMYNGIGLLGLSMLAAVRQRRLVRTAWMTGVLLACLTMQVVSAVDYSVALHGVLVSLVEKHYVPPIVGILLTRKVHALRRPETIDISALQTLLGDAKLATPVSLEDSNVEEQLRNAGLTSPDYYFSLVGVWDEQAERRKMHDLDAFTFALLPKGSIEYLETPAAQARALGGGIQSRIRQPVYYTGKLLNADLAQHWTPREQVGSYILYEHRGHE